ncbi:hypothetical protein AB0O64_17760 [Streptomyces sp. NPDC088341]|uniref:hypothetical protein n=1 Tax=Streptomyces sp. NPDC088341 TaxID=3154870 RepID=UPI0034379D45
MRPKPSRTLGWPGGSTSIVPKWGGGIRSGSAAPGRVAFSLMWPTTRCRARSSVIRFLAATTGLLILQATPYRAGGFGGRRGMSTEIRRSASETHTMSKNSP